MLPFDLHPDATDEIREGVCYHDQNPPGKGDEFREAVYDAISFVRKFPAMGTVRANGARTRRALGFDWLIAYQETADGILVLAVFHGKRRPDYWASRLVTD